MSTFQKVFAIFLQYLPSVLQAVIGIEQAQTSLPGPQKKAVVVGAVAAAAQQAGAPLPPDHAVAVANINDAVVAALNASGAFTKSTGAAQ